MGVNQDRANAQVRTEPVEDQHPDSPSGSVEMIDRDAVDRRGVHVEEVHGSHAQLLPLEGNRLARCTDGSALPGDSSRRRLRSMSARVPVRHRR